jgi:homoserine O-succinyltransferase/O-acetyltransferase
MPVLMDIESRDHHLFKECEDNRAKISRAAALKAIRIGLVNNMPDPALISTERQIFNLLNCAAGTIPVRLQLYALPAVVRGDWGRRYISHFYAPPNAIWDSGLDGVIVTGAEPLATELSDEPYWGSLGRLIDWAAEETTSAFWSCLAVHAAVLYLDGIGRHRLGEKCSGVFRQAIVEKHSLTRGVPSRWSVPHSRWNEVHETSLDPAGYRILTKSADAGVDMFVKQRKRSLFVYFQGHPEYDAHSLLGEYRRDIGRYLRREIECYPTMPHGYFDEESTRLLTEYQMRSLSDRRKELFTSFPVDCVAANLKNTWQFGAIRIYRNWILSLSERQQSAVSHTSGAIKTRRLHQHRQTSNPCAYR